MTSTPDSPLGVPHPFGDLIGIESDPTDDSPGSFSLKIQDEHRNPHGVVHGAILYGLIDTGMGQSVVTTLDETQLCTTIEIKISYLRPAMDGILYSRINVVRRGKKICFLDGEIIDEKNRVLVTATGTFMIYDLPKQ